MRFTYLCARVRALIGVARTSPPLPPSFAPYKTARAQPQPQAQTHTHTNTQAPTYTYLCRPTTSPACAALSRRLRRHMIALQGLPMHPGPFAARLRWLPNTKADSTLRSSQAVPHPSTNRALRRLTSEVERDPVHSTRYGRQRETMSTRVYIAHAEARREARAPTCVRRRSRSTHTHTRTSFRKSWRAATTQNGMCALFW